MKKLLAVLTIFALSVTGAAFAASKAKQTHGVAYVGVTHTENNNKDLYVSGDFNDNVLGRGAIVYVTNVTSGTQTGTYNVNAKRVTIYTTKGTLTGTGGGLETIHQDGTSDVTNGKFNLTKGTGTYKGHTFKGTFSGPLKSGVFTFTYNATYK
jgi:hypothetical protein